jgi:hypothetical protein
MAVIYVIAKKLQLGSKNNFTISIEVGLKNSIVAIYVAESLLNNYEMAMVSVIYGSITFFSTLLFGYIAKRIELWGFGTKNYSDLAMEISKKAVNFALKKKIKRGTLILSQSKK